MASTDRTVVRTLGQHRLQLGPEGELVEIRQQRVDPLAAFALVDEFEELALNIRVAAPDAGTNFTTPRFAAAFS